MSLWGHPSREARSRVHGDGTSAAAFINLKQHKVLEALQSRRRDMHQACFVCHSEFLAGGVLKLYCVVEAVEDTWYFRSLKTGLDWNLIGTS
jgi:hypothetical protein